MLAPVIASTPAPIVLPPATPLPGGLAGLPTTTTPSGLIVVHNELTPVTKGSQLVIVDKPLTGDGALEAAKAAYAEMAAQSGTVAADVMYGDTVAQVQQIRSDEIRRQAVEALLAGDFARAAELISQA